MLIYLEYARQAFKEWVVVVDALMRGEQIVIFSQGRFARKGRGGFQIDHSELLAFSDALFHQQRDQVIPTAQARFDELAPHFPAANVLRLEAFAEVVAWRQLDQLESARNV